MDNSITKTELEIEKLRLEKKKLTEEIRHLQRPLYLNPQYAGPFAAIIVATFTIAFGFLNGNFEAKTSILENKRLVIENQIKDFQKEKVSLQTDINKTKEQIRKLEKEKFDLQMKSLKYQSDYLSSRNRYNRIQNKLDLQSLDITTQLLAVADLLLKKDNEGAYSKLRSVIFKLNNLKE